MNRFTQHVVSDCPLKLPLDAEQWRWYNIWHVDMLCRIL